LRPSEETHTFSLVVYVTERSIVGPERVRQV
jgi:hypothetical protein